MLALRISINKCDSKMYNLQFKKLYRNKHSELTFSHFHQNEYIFCHHSALQLFIKFSDLSKAVQYAIGYFKRIQYVHPSFHVSIENELDAFNKALKDLKALQCFFKKSISYFLFTFCAFVLFINVL